MEKLVATMLLPVKGTKVIGGTDKVIKVTLLISLALTIYILEEFLPRPLPWAKLGLSNIVTMIALILWGFKEGLYVAIIRTIVGSLLLGSFLTPAFILSFAGAMASLIVMTLTYRLYQRYFSIVTISVLGALTHNLTQIGLVYLLLVRHLGIFFQLPLLLILGLATGTFNGLVVYRLGGYLKINLGGGGKFGQGK